MQVCGSIVWFAGYAILVYNSPFPASCQRRLLPSRRPTVSTLLGPGSNLSVTQPCRWQQNARPTHSLHPYPSFCSCLCQPPLKKKKTEARNYFALTAAFWGGQSRSRGGKWGKRSTPGELSGGHLQIDEWNWNVPAEASARCAQVDVISPRVQNSISVFGEHRFPSRKIKFYGLKTLFKNIRFKNCHKGAAQMQ